LEAGEQGRKLAAVCSVTAVNLSPTPRPAPVPNHSVGANLSFTNQKIDLVDAPTVRSDVFKKEAAQAQISYRETSSRHCIASRPTKFWLKGMRDSPFSKESCVLQQ